MIGVGSAIPNNAMSLRVPASVSSRILDIPCKVCGDNSSGKHYNIFACDGCAGFFKRSIRKNRQYICKAKASGSCVVDKTHRNQCRACRLIKCQEAGMNKDAVQHERGPRNSTLRRQQQQMVQLLNDTRPKLMPSPPNGVLDLAMSSPGPSPRFQPPLTLSPTSFFGAPVPAIPRMPLVFHLPEPIEMNPQHICEAAARLLFFNITWAKSVTYFTALPLSDQLLLLEDSWKELFILAAAQNMPPLNLNPLIQCCNLIKEEPSKVSLLENEVREFQATLAKIAQFKIDIHELLFLRTLVLFKTSCDRDRRSPPVGGTSQDKKMLTDFNRVAAIQDNVQLMLNRYILTTYPDQPLRFGKLLLLLPALRAVSSSMIEELFFRNTIGNVSLVSVICNMYSSSVNSM